MRLVSPLLFIFFFAFSVASFGQNRAIEFDGVDDYLEFEHTSEAFTTDQNFTISLRLRLTNVEDSLSNKQFIFFKEAGDGHWLRIWLDTQKDNHDQYKIKVSRSDVQYSPSLTSSAAINDGEWHHIALVKNQRMLLFYLDGTMDAYVRDNTNGITEDQTPAYIGGAEGNFLSGALDDLSIRNESINAAAIKMEVTDGNNGSKDQVFFDFESNEGDIVSSAAGNGQLLLQNFDTNPWTDGPEILQNGGGSGWWAELSRAYENYKNGEAVNLSERFMWQSIFLFLVLAALSYGVFRWILNQRQKKAREREAEIQTELSSKKKELVSQTLHLVNKNAVLNDLKQDLSDYQKASESNLKQINRMINNLKMENASEASWEVFKSQFLEMHDGFDRTLRERNDKITDNEIRLAALVKMKLNNKEIAEMLNVQAESVKKSKFRLKKKLNLEADVDLGQFLEKL